jgi:hypothetical protein
MVTRALGVVLLILGFVDASAAQTTPTLPAVTLFQNVRIFDGKGDTVSGPMNILIRGNVIERITTAPIAPQASYTVIDGL